MAEKRKIRELDAVLARKNAEYRRLRESREKLESESEELNSSSVSERSASSVSDRGNSSSQSSKPGKKTFVTSGKARFSGVKPPSAAANMGKKAEDGKVNIYKPNIPSAQRKKEGRRLSSSSSKRSLSSVSADKPSKNFVKENINAAASVEKDPGPLLTSAEEAKVQQLMIEYMPTLPASALPPPEAEKADSVSKPEPELTVAQRPSLAVTPKGHTRSVLDEGTISKLDQIDESLRQLIPIDRWEQWSIKSSIRSITTDSLMAESAPSRCMESVHTLDSLAKGKKRFKSSKPGDKFLKKLAEERETRQQLSDVDKKFIELQQSHRKLKGVITEEDQAVSCVALN